MPVSQIEGRIPGFGNKWNATQTQICLKEDTLRWNALEKQVENRAKEGKFRSSSTLPRAHSCIGPFPGCRRNIELSPRKSASMCYIEQKLQNSSFENPKRPSTREKLYAGISGEEQGRYEYLKRRTRYNVDHRFGKSEEALPTTSMRVGFKRPVGEYRASKFCHKPIIEAGFYRPNDVCTFKNLPIQQS